MLVMKSVMVVMVVAEEVCARWCLAGDAATSVKFRPGSLKQEFKVNWGVKCERQRES